MEPTVMAAGRAGGTATVTMSRTRFVMVHESYCNINTVRIRISAAVHCDQLIPLIVMLNSAIEYKPGIT
jgi:hypothetical protein